MATTDPNVLSGPEGPSMEVLGRTGLLYREGDRAMHVDSEVLLGEVAMVVYAGSVKRWKAPIEAIGFDQRTGTCDRPTLNRRS